MMGLPCGEEVMIVGRTMWTQSTSVTEGQTDGRTDRITITDTVQTASHGKNEIFRHSTGIIHNRIDSAPRLGVYYFLSLTLSVCMSVCHIRAPSRRHKPP